MNWTIEKVDYDYYTNVFGGTELTEEQFNSVIDAVYELMAYMTMQRIRTDELSPDVQTQIKNTACAAAQALCRDTSRAGIVSENNDGYSVTYALSQNGGSSGIYKGCADIMKIYLAGTGLLYRGL